VTEHDRQAEQEGTHSARANAGGTPPQPDGLDLVEFLRATAEDAGSSELPWLHVIEELLRRGRAGTATVTGLSRDEVDAMLAWREDVAAEVTAIVRRAGDVSSLVEHDVLVAVAERVNEALTVTYDVSPARLVVAGHAVALGLDRAVRRTLETFFLAENAQVIRDGAVYPVRHLDLTEPSRLIPEPFNTSPVSVQDLAFDRTAGLRLGDHRADEYRFVLDGDAHDRLAELATVQRLRIAACQPNVRLDEYDLRPEPGEEGFPPADASDDRFANHGPTSPDQEEVAKRLLSIACAHGCQVIVLPEYALTEAQRAGVFAFLGQLAETPVLVVGGSARIATEHGASTRRVCGCHAAASSLSSRPTRRSSRVGRRTWTGGNGRSACS